jgi:hypothetical protein
MIKLCVKYFTTSRVPPCNIIAAENACRSETASNAPNHLGLFKSTSPPKSAMDLRRLNHEEKMPYEIEP